MARWLLAALALAACTADPVSRPRPGEPVASSPTTAAPTTPAAAPTVIVEPKEAHFSSPTKNIGCYAGPEAASCEIYDHDWDLPPRPADCDADWGAGVLVNAGGVEVGRCATDTVLGAERVLPYGTTVRTGDVECRSERSGITCTFTPTGRGFTISRAALRTF